MDCDLPWPTDGIDQTMKKAHTNAVSSVDIEVEKEELEFFNEG